MRIQLDGEIQFGTAPDALTDYSNEVSSLIINMTRPGVERPATYGTPRTETRLGPRQDQVTINFFSDEDEPDGLWTEFYEAMNTDDGELYFSGRHSLTGRTWTGIIGVADLDAGTTVGEWKQQSKTFPAREVDVTAIGS